MQQEGAGQTLRPLGVGEILDVAFKVYTRNVATFMGIVAIIFLPVGLFFTLAILSVVPDASRIRSGQVEFPINEPDTGFLVVVIVVAILGWLATFLATGAGVRAVADAYLGKKPTIGGSYAYVGKRFHSLIWIVFLFGLIVTVSIIGIILPIYFAVAFAFAVNIVVIEGIKGTKALRKSYNLVRGSWWRTFGILLLGFVLIPTVLQYAITIPLQIGIEAVDIESVTTYITINQIIATIAQIVATPVQIAVLTVLYFDLRVRKEAFDLQLLTERIEGPPGQVELPQSGATQQQSPTEPPTSPSG